ncbi:MULTISPECIES: siderophore ferric iron reductase [unclassified Variovorax]|uniref:siderophore ferric iron reductase n=1 Tax=unclassified Variovorax TaxID=663243 RepID=UPI003ECF0915
MTLGMQASASGSVVAGAMPAARPDPDLARMLRLAQRIVPGLCGTQGSEVSPGALREGDQTSLRALCRHWAEAYPEAGAHYRALRCWGLAIWQPVYLSVIAAHQDTHVPRLAGLAQPVAEGFPRGFQLPVHAPVTGSASARMDAAAAELRVFCDSMRAALAPSVALHARAADRLQAECVLGALLLVHRHAPACSDSELAALGVAWLARLGIAGGCGFFAYRARDGTPALALDRKVCCHHFRRRDGEQCSTCPKLPLDTRIARLLADS